MSEAALLEKIDSLTQTVARLEDLEDLRALEDAIVENAGQPLISWERAKAELEMD